MGMDSLRRSKPIDMSEINNDEAEICIHKLIQRICTKTLPSADTVLGLAGHGRKNTKHLLSENLNFSEGDSSQENEQKHSSLWVVDVL